MKNMNLLFTSILLSLTFLFSSCENAKIEIKTKSKHKIDHQTLKSKIEEVNKTLEEAIIKPDYDKILSYYTDDIVAMQEFRPAIKGKDKMRELCDARVKAGVKFHDFKFNMDTCWSNGNEAYEYGKVLISSSSKENPVPFIQTGGYCKIYEIRDDNTYLVKYMIANLDHNPCAGKK